MKYNENMEFNGYPKLVTNILQDILFYEKLIQVWNNLRVTK